MKTAIRQLKRLSKDCEGAAVLEFAIVGLTVVALAPLLYDLSNVVSNFMTLNGSMRAGVQYALKYPSDTTGITSAIQKASGFPNNITVTNTQSCQCSGTTATCGSTCSNGSTPGQFQTITASYNVPTLLPYANYPNNSFTITQTLMVRVQ